MHHVDISNFCEYQRPSICVKKSINFKLILEAFDYIRGEQQMMIAVAL